MCDADTTDPGELTAAIRRAGFTPQIVETTASRPSVQRPNQQLDTSKLPDDLVALLAQAKRDNKLVLLRFTGPG